MSWCSETLSSWRDWGIKHDKLNKHLSLDGLARNGSDAVEQTDQTAQTAVDDVCMHVLSCDWRHCLYLDEGGQQFYRYKPLR